MTDTTTSTQELTWWERPLRIAAQQCEVEDNPAQVVEKWANMGFNVEQLLHISAQGWLGRYDPARSEEIRSYIAKAHALGLHIIFYYGGQWLDKDIRTAHPDWQACTKDGTPMDQACMGHVGFQAWTEELLVSSLDLGADGIFLDGAYTAPNGCYCPRCRAEFQAMFGTDMLAEENHEQRHRLTEHRMRVVEGYLSRMERAIHSKHPEAVFYLNMPGTHPLRTRGVDMRRHLVYQDMVGVEGGFVYYSPAHQIPLWKAGAAAKLIEAVGGGKPAVTFCAADHKPWNLYHITGPEATITYCEAIANGSNIWFGLHTPHFREAVQTPAMRAVARMNHFTARHEAYYTRTSSTARVAMLFSYDTAEEYRYLASDSDFVASGKGKKSGIVGDFSQSWMGCYEALLRSHIQFDMIDATTVTSNSMLREQYDLIVLPTVACVSADLAQALERYVTAGGNVLATHDVGTFDECGRPWDTPILAHLLGVDFTGQPISMSRYSYMSVAEGDGRLTQGITQPLLPAPEWAWEVKLAGAQALAWFHKPHQSQYSPLADIGTPAITRHHVGAGTVMYIAGTWFEGYYTDRIPDHRIITENIVRLLAQRSVEVQGVPGSVEVICRSQVADRRIIVHLINLTGDMNRPIEEIIPIDRRFELRFSKTFWATQGITLESLSARLLMAGKHLSVHEEANHLVVSVSGLQDYEVLVLEPTV